MKRATWSLLALVPVAASVSCGEEAADTAGGGTGGTSGANGAGEAGDRDWPHAEGGDANLAEQLLEGCIGMCTVFEAIEAHTPCEPGQRMRYGIIVDSEGAAGSADRSKLAVNPVCPQWCEDDLIARPPVCLRGEVELVYCTEQAEFICDVRGLWYWNDCWEIDSESYCSPE